MQQHDLTRLGATPITLEPYSEINPHVKPVVAADEEPPKPKRRKNQKPTRRKPQKKRKTVAELERNTDKWRTGLYCIEVFGMFLITGLLEGL